VREGPGVARWRKAVDARACRRSGRAGTDLAQVLRDLSGDEPRPVCAAAAIEPGAGGAAAGRACNGERWADRQAVWDFRARPLRRGLSDDLRGDAIDDAAKFFA